MHALGLPPNPAVERNVFDRIRWGAGTHFRGQPAKQNRKTYEKELLYILNWVWEGRKTIFLSAAAHSHTSVFSLNRSPYRHNPPGERLMVSTQTPGELGLQGFGGTIIIHFSGHHRSHPLPPPKPKKNNNILYSLLSTNMKTQKKCQASTFFINEKNRYACPTKL